LIFLPVLLSALVFFFFFFFLDLVGLTAVVVVVVDHLHLHLLMDYLFSIPYCLLGTYKNTFSHIYICITNQIKITKKKSFLS